MSENIQNNKGSACTGLPIRPLRKKITFYCFVIRFCYICKKYKAMSTATPRTGKVQTILRMSAETYEAIRRAARRSGRSFNRYAVETLEEAVNPPEKKISLKGVLLDPEWYSFMIPSLDLTEEEIREDPRLSAILGL